MMEFVLGHLDFRDNSNLESFSSPPDPIVTHRSN